MLRKSSYPQEFQMFRTSTQKTERKISDMCDTSNLTHRFEEASANPKKLLRTVSSTVHELRERLQRFLPNTILYPQESVIPQLRIGTLSFYRADELPPVPDVTPLAVVQDEVVQPEKEVRLLTWSLRVFAESLIC